MNVVDILVFLEIVKEQVMNGNCDVEHLKLLKLLFMELAND